MAVLATVLVIGVAGGVVIAGVGKMFYQLKMHATRSPRPRQPWEVGGPT